MTKLQQLANTIAEAGHEAGKMQWTTEVPTVPGWYWTWAGQNEILKKNPPEVVRVESVEDGGRVVMRYAENIFSFDYWTHWLGPIPEPSPPG